MWITFILEYRGFFLINSIFQEGENQKMGISKMKTHQKKHKQWAHKQQQQPPIYLASTGWL
jgi:hypothetical protein